MNWIIAWNICKFIIFGPLWNYTELQSDLTMMNLIIAWNVLKLIIIGPLRNPRRTFKAIWKWWISLSLDTYVNSSFSDFCGTLSETAERFENDRYNYRSKHMYRFRISVEPYTTLQIALRMMNFIVAWIIFIIFGPLWNPMRNFKAIWKWWI